MEQTCNVFFGPADCQQIPIPLPMAANGERFVIPADHFAWQSRVRDEIADVCNVGGHLALENWRPLDDHERPTNSMVLVLESPHKTEYAINEGIWTPLGPLIGSRRHLSRHIEAVLSEVDMARPGVHVILSNPVPYQCSLARLLPRQEPLRAETRDEVWTRLFVAGFANDFRTRLQRYAPGAVVNACTKNLKSAVNDAAAEAGYPARLECRHPSVWMFGWRLAQRRARAQ